MLSSWKDAGEEAATPAEGFASSSFLTTEAAEVVEETPPDTVWPPASMLLETVCRSCRSEKSKKLTKNVL